MITYLDGKKLWVDGEKAYSVEELQESYERIKTRNMDGKVSLDQTVQEIDRLSAQRDQLLLEIQSDNLALSEIEKILLEIERREDIPVEDPAITIREVEEVEMPEEVVHEEADNEEVEMPEPISHEDASLLFDDKHKKPKKIIF